MELLYFISNCEFRRARNGILYSPEKLTASLPVLVFCYSESFYCRSFCIFCRTSASWLGPADFLAWQGFWAAWVWVFALQNLPGEALAIRLVVTRINKPSSFVEGGAREGLLSIFILRNLVAEPRFWKLSLPTRRQRTQDSKRAFLIQVFLLSVWPSLPLPLVLLEDRDGLGCLLPPNPWCH